MGEEILLNNVHWLITNIQNILKRNNSLKNKLRLPESQRKSPPFKQDKKFTEEPNYLKYRILNPKLTEESAEQQPTLPSTKSLFPKSADDEQPSSDSFENENCDFLLFQQYYPNKLSVMQSRSQI